VVVNPDASRCFAGRASEGPVPHGPGARGGSSGSADRRHAGRDIGPPAHSRRHNRSDRGRSSCKQAPASDNGHTGKTRPAAPARARPRIRYLSWPPFTAKLQILGEVIGRDRLGSAIVMTGSVTGLLGNKNLLDYSMTKGGIHAFVRSLATHLIDKDIRVNAVAPGPVWTPLNPADRNADAVSKFGSETPMKRPAQPEKIAPAFVFLAAPSCSSYITGEILPIIGGYTGG
jgi:NAD(P)-dependent dehydrogenase (short-subunit alcohol dehydrogenase family)